MNSQIELLARLDEEVRERQGMLVQYHTPHDVAGCG
jgi:hypothetical protein